MRTITRVGSIIKSRDFKPKDKEKYLLNLIQKNGGDGYIRKGNFSSEIVWDSKSYIFPTKGEAKTYKKEETPKFHMHISMFEHQKYHFLMILPI